MSKELLPVCCGTPLIYTFMFSGAEYFCRKCKCQYGIMNVYNKELTDDLKKEHEENKKWFSHIAKDCIPYRSKIVDCDKCIGDEYHFEHATDEEKLKSSEAYNLLIEKE